MRGKPLGVFRSRGYRMAEHDLLAALAAALEAPEDDDDLDEDDDDLDEDDDDLDDDDDDLDEDEESEDE
jgi:hypothetical protein